MPRSASIMLLPLLALGALAHAAPQELPDPFAARQATELALPPKDRAPAAPTANKDYSLWGGSHNLGGVILDMRGALARNEPELGNHYEFALRLPLLADEVNRLTMFATAHYTDRSQMKDGQTLVPRPEITIAQSRANGFVTQAPQQGRSSVVMGVNLRHKVNRAWALDGSVGAFQMNPGTPPVAPGKAPAKKLKPLLQGNASYSF